MSDASSPETPPVLEDLGHGIAAIDTGFVRPFFDASHLLIEGGRAAFVDVGTIHSVPGLLAALGGAFPPRPSTG